MSKPVVTYMRKKTRPTGQEDIYKESNPPTASAPYRSKRSRAQSSAYKAPSNPKKSKTSMIENLQTPYPTALSESQAFRLQSSRGHPLPSDHEFSPVPPALKSTLINSSTTPSQRAYMNRSTRFLKENDANGIASRYYLASRSRSQVGLGLDTARLGLLNNMSVSGCAKNDLASPFSSRPSSPPASPADGGTSRLISGAVHDVVPKGFMAMIDTTSPTRSLRSSPTYGDEPITTLSARRPSAPTTSRPKLQNWVRLLPQVSDPTFRESAKKGSGRESIGLFSSALEPSDVCSEHTSIFNEREKWTWSDAAVDFNRPPSQLSFHSDFFEDVQGASTPLRDIKNSQRSSYLADDQEMGSINHPTLHSLFSDDDYSSTITSAVNSWISDSLISPPSIYRNRNRNRNRKRKYQSERCTRNEDAYNDEGEPEDEDEVPDCSGNDIYVATHVINTEQQDGSTHNLASDALEENCLALSWCAEKLSIKDVPKTTSPIGVGEPTLGVKLHPSARKRRGTIRAVEIASQPQKTTQTRRSRSGTIVGPAARRTRSGTIIGPVSQIGGSQISMTGKSATLALSDGGDQPLSVDGIGNNVVVDEDELDSFNKEWVDEPWTVADPPSPVTLRTRKNTRTARAGKVQPMQKRTIIKFGLHEGITENAAGESDDELLLK